MDPIMLASIVSMGIGIVVGILIALLVYNLTF